MSEDHGAVMSTGISAGALWYCLRDLTDKATALPPGELRDTWVKAAESMSDSLGEAMGAHRSLTGNEVTP
jgi:hypothetical protein